jgi:hypothetical protein
MGLLTTSLVLFHIFQIRSEPRINFSFQSNERGSAVTSMYWL